MTIQNDNVRHLSALDQRDLMLAGGKASALGEMINAGFPVPPGFCLTTNAYRRFVADNGLDRVISDGSGPVVQKAFAAAVMPEALKAQIGAAYAELELDAVAVRSSATAEDLPDASFAGQQDTYLNVRGIEAVIEAVKNCWGSLWTERVIEYRARAGFPPEDVAMGVVVQAMVDAESAGVLFSANPVTGARDQIVINAAWGLGEAVVSGLVTPDTLSVTKVGDVIDARIARKTVMTCYGKTGVEERRVAKARQSIPVLSDAQIGLLVALSNKVEAHENRPVDLEWAFAGDRLFLLQARPITVLPEPLDEVDTEGCEWSRLMLIERYPDPLTPFTASTMSKVFFQSFDRVFKLMGGRLRKDDRMIGMFFGRPYVNASLLASAGFQTSTAIETDADIKRKKPGLISFARLVGVVLGTHRQWDRLQSPAETFARRENAKSWAGADIPALLTAMDRQEASVRPLLDNHANSIIAAELTLQLLNTINRKWLGDENGALAPTLLAGLEGNMTVKTNRDLWRLAGTVRNNSGLCRYLKAGPGPDWRQDIAALDGGDDFLALLDGFLVTYGHRSPKYEFRHPSWSENPKQVLEMIRMYLDDSIPDPAEGEARQAKARHEAEAQARKALSPGKRLVFNRVLALAQTYFRLRENQQFYLMMILPSQQRILRELGRHLSRAGWFDEPDDVYFLPQEDIMALARALLSRPEDVPRTCKETLADLRRNRADLERFKRMDAPLTLGGNPPPAEQGSALAGVAGSKGIARGPARIILDPDGFGDLRPGEILVSPATTPAWTPLFGIAAGLVTDYGGLLSHSGVVAREYGLPAVLGVGNATKLLKTGEMVEIDGTLGTIRKI